ncbi:MAG: MFS transporter [Candidatus Thorarchaeota archaeon]|nr:MFS transporter [Candidatus Thorarchaeota archaeon]
MKTETIQIMAGAAVLSAFTYVPILARDYLGANEFYVTLLVSSYAAAMFLSSYIFGRAGDIYGRRIVLRIGLLLSTLSFAFLLIASSPESLFIIRVLNGFCIGIYPGALAAYAHESKMAMGRFATFGALGWGIGTALAGLAAGFNIYYAFGLSSLFYMMAFAASMKLPPIEHTEMDVPLLPMKTLKQNLPVYLAILIRHSSASAVWTLWPLLLSDLGANFFMIGIVQASNSISQVIFMAAITDRIGYEKLVIMGLLASAVTFAWFALVTNIIQMIPAQILLGFSWACLYVGALRYVTDRNQEKSTASGLLQSMMSISGVIGPIIATILYFVWPSYTPILLNAMIMSFVAFVIFTYGARKRNAAKSGYADTGFHF